MFKYKKKEVDLSIALESKEDEFNEYHLNSEEEIKNYIELNYEF